MRALLIVLDSVGIGNAPDARKFGDEGANTVGHILEKNPDLKLPHLDSIGLSRVLKACGGESVPSKPDRLADYGWMQEVSSGKDTVTGHWEITGNIIKKPFAVYDWFPEEILAEVTEIAGTEFIGNYAASGTEIIETLGEEHLETGKPILYTSADSVMQVAAHEEHFGLDRLYKICEDLRPLCDKYKIARVIARPFVGEVGSFTRTGNRHDYAIEPPPTILDALHDRAIPVISVGKIWDIFCGKGIEASYPTKSNAEGMKTIGNLWPELKEGLIFANLVDFDSLFGHRRDHKGYAQALKEFDDWLGDFLPKIGEKDLVIITADHGNDPTWKGTDHTRELVPVFVISKKSSSKLLGHRDSFADVAQTLAKHFRIPEWKIGESMI